MYAKDTFPKRLKALREAIGISQEEFAKVLKVSRPTISYYERGERTPDIDMLDRINEVTGCSTNYLMGYSDNMKSGYEEIGLITSLSDESINMLMELDYSGEELNFIVSHPYFAQIVEALMYYPYSFEAVSPHDALFGNTQKEYTKYCMMHMMGKIADDYYDIHDKAIMKEGSFVPENMRNTLLFEKHLQEGLNDIKHHKRFVLTDILDRPCDPDESEAIKEMRKIAEKRKKQEEQFELEHNEKMENDPVYRFRQSMLCDE